MRREDRNEGRKAVRAAERRHVLSRSIRFVITQTPLQVFLAEMPVTKFPTPPKSGRPNFYGNWNGARAKKRWSVGRWSNAMRRERESERAERCAKTREKNLGRAKFSRLPSRSNATPTPNRTKITARNPILLSPLLSLSFFARSLFTSMDWSMEWIGRLIHSRQCQSAHTSKMRSGGERGAQIQTVTE